MTDEQIERRLAELRREYEGLDREVRTLQCLSPELSLQVLVLREEMNARKEFVNGRVLLLPPGTGFTGKRLYGFDVRVVDKPMALGPLDFPQGSTFTIKRS